MIKRKLKIRFIVTVFLLMILTASFVAVFVSGQEEKDVIFEGVNLESEYFQNEKLQLPSGRFVYGDEEFAADCVLTYPNGKAYQTQSVVLSDAGVYTAEYRAVIGGKLYKETFQFNVRESLYGVSGSVSNAVYGADLTTHNYETGISGINLTLAQGETFYYNNVIDLSGNTASDGIITMFAAPSQGFRTLDAEFVYLTLTDLYDPDNAVTVEIKSWTSLGADWEGWGAFVAGNFYARARATGQLPKGISGGLVNINNPYGTPIAFSTYGSTSNVGEGQTPDTQSSVVGKQFLTLSYDDEDKTVFFNGVKIIDLDDEAYQETLFPGFTTGEVLLTISASGYLSKTTDWVITQIDDDDLTKNVSDSEKSVYLSIDTSAWGEDEIFGCVGTPFPLFPAQARHPINMERITDVKTRVFFNYYSSTAYEYPIVNGCFVPDKAGIYTVLYSAVGADGKTVVKEMSINVRYPSDMNFTFEEYETEGTTGYPVSLAQIANVSGNAGKYTTEISISDEQGNSVEYSGNEFIPQEAGIYKVSYLLRDYLGREAKNEYEVNVKLADLPVLTETPGLPKYFLSDSVYTLPEITAYDYEAKEEIVLSVRVEDQDGVRVLEDGRATFSGEKAKVEYFYGENVLFSREIPIVAGKESENGSIRYNKDAYFALSGDASIIAEEDDLLLLSGGSSAASFEYINPLLAENSSFVLNVDSAKKQFDRLNIYLSDRNNAEIVVKISFVRSVMSEGRSVMFINDVPYSLMTTAFNLDGVEDAQLNLSYKDSTSSISVKDGGSQTVKTCLNGRAFEGFPSGFMYVRFELEDVKGESALKLFSINDQAMNSNRIDRIAPQYKQAEYQRSFDIGYELTVERPLFADVLDANPTATVTVTDPKGNYVRAGEVELNGVPLAEYKFKMDQYGAYLIKYVYTDASGRSAEDSYQLVVVDKEPPILTLDESAVPSKVSSGDKVKLPSAAANDGIDGSVTVHCLMILPNGRIEYLKNGEEYKFSAKGSYCLKYIALDSEGNQCEKSFNIQVK